MMQNSVFHINDIVRPIKNKIRSNYESIKSLRVIKVITADTFPNYMQYDILECMILKLFNNDYHYTYKVISIHANSVELDLIQIDFYEIF